MLHLKMHPALPQTRASKPRARLTEEEVIQIFNAKVDSPPSATLATIYHVSEKTVRDIWKGRTWSRETSHLDPSRTLQHKQPGRPKGSLDSQPRKKRGSRIAPCVLSSPLMGTTPASHVPDKLVRREMDEGRTFDQSQIYLESDVLKTKHLQFSPQGYDEVYPEQCSEQSSGSSAWHRSDPSLSYNTTSFKRPSAQPHASLDDQLHCWDAFWRITRCADPFRGDWTPKPFQYDD